MTILSLAGVKAKPPVCDFLKLTFPRERQAEVLDVVGFHTSQAGGRPVCDGLWHVLPYSFACPDDIVIAAKKPGTVKTGAVGQVATLGISGVACAGFRERKVWLPFLAELAQFEHKVTGLEVAKDYEVDAPPFIAEAAAAGRGGGVRLGRKAVAPADVTETRSLDARGVMTGSVYLRKRASAEVRATIYDKRHEREGFGFLDPGPTLRVELKLGNVMASLRDAVEPEPIFHHYGAGLVPTPRSVPDWLAVGAGFFLEPKRERDYWRALQAGVDGLRFALDELAKLADHLGEYGRRMLLGLIADQIGAGDFVVRNKSYVH